MSDSNNACPRAPKCGNDYQAKLSGPLLDRFDLFVDVPAVSIDDLQKTAANENSARISARVQRARDAALTRHQNAFGVGIINTRLQGDALEKVTALNADGMVMIKNAADKLKLSARAYHRVLRVARTIADLDASDTIQTNHLAEALAFRRRSDTTT